MPDRAGRPVLNVPVTTTGVLAACFSPRGEILLVRHSGSERIAEGMFGLPGGRVEEGEHPGQAALRELQEETGLVGNPDLTFALPRIWISDVDQPAGTSERISLQVWLVFAWEGELQGSGSEEPCFVPLDRVGYLPLLPNGLSMIHAAFELYAYCWTLAAKEAGVELPPGAETLLDLSWDGAEGRP